MLPDSIGGGVRIPLTESIDRSRTIARGPMPNTTDQNQYAARAADARRADKSSTDAQAREHRPERTDHDDALTGAPPTTIDPANEDSIALMLADAMPQMVWSARADGFHDHFNAGWYAFTGVPEGAINGSPWDDMCHIDDRKRASALCEGASRPVIPSRSSIGSNIIQKTIDGCAGVVCRYAMEQARSYGG